MWSEVRSEDGAIRSRTLEVLGDFCSVTDSLCPLPWVVFYDRKRSDFGV